MPHSSAAAHAHIEAPKDCTGCALCANVCSHQAISMVWSQEGFLIPHVDEDACTHCGVCVRMCPALRPAPPSEKLKDCRVEAYGAWHRSSEVHRSSSSGGIFTALAEQTIARGGCVFGVIWQDKLHAVFTKAETLDELAAMRGSKYTMAIPGAVYQEVRRELKKGRRVLFAGTPCQVHALRTLLRRPNENLLTLDVVCHGVPSRLLLERYIEEAEASEGKSVQYVDFRDKRSSWLNYSQTCWFSDGSRLSHLLHEDAYMSLFLSDVLLNRCCYHCRYSHFPRQGDITLGDFWGVQELHPDWPIREGISAVLVNSERGNRALSSLNASVELRPVSPDEIIRFKPQSYQASSSLIPGARRQVLRELPRKPLADLVQRYTGGKWLGPIFIPAGSLLGRMLRRLRRRLNQLRHLR